MSKILDTLRSLRAGSEEATISGFLAAHKTLAEGLKRAGELDGVLTPPALANLDRVQRLHATRWPYLQGLSDLDQGVRDKAVELGDLLKRENFFRELHKIDQTGRILEAEYEKRFDAVSSRRSSVYEEALNQLKRVPAWSDVKAEYRARVSEVLERCAKAPDPGTPIPQLESDVEACPTRLKQAVKELEQIVDGERLATVEFASFFHGGVETEEQLEAALKRLKEECLKLIGAGKRILIQ